MGAFGNYVEEGHFYVFGHAGGVAADVEVGSAFKPRVEFVAVFLHAVLDVDLFALVAGEGGVELGEEAVFFHGEELIFVEVVGEGALLAEEEPVVAFGGGGLALFEEGSEGGYAGAGADHDDGGVGVFGEAEGVVFVQEDGHGGADDAALAEVAGGDALAVSAVGGVADYSDGGVDLVGVRGLAGGDGVHARGEALEDVEELLRLGDDAGELGDEVDELAAPDVLFGVGFVFCAEEGFEGCGWVVAAELGELVEAAAG